MPILTICFDLMILETITNEKKRINKIEAKNYIIFI